MKREAAPDFHFSLCVCVCVHSMIFSPYVEHFFSFMKAALIKIFYINSRSDGALVSFGSLFLFLSLHLYVHCSHGACFHCCTLLLLAQRRQAQKVCDKLVTLRSIQLLKSQTFTSGVSKEQNGAKEGE